MDVKNRLTKLEQNSSIEPKEADAPEVCEHPPSMFKFYRDYPAKGYSDRRLVTKGHCNICGFDDYLWSFYALTGKQETRRQELGFFEQMDYEAGLIEAGLIKYALFPPPPEVQIRFTGKVTV